MKWKWAVKAEELIGLSEQGESSVAGSAVDMTRAAYTERTVHLAPESSYSTQTLP